MAATLGALTLSFIAGWLVNLMADSIPTRLPLQQSWYWPFAQVRRVFVGQGVLLEEELMELPPPRRYLLVWGMALLLGYSAYGSYGWRIEALVIALQAWFFLAIAVIDLEHRLVLNRMLLIAMPCILLLNLAVGLATITSALLGAMTGFGFFLLLAILSPGGMGMGDVKLAGLIGLTTGLSNVMVALFIGILTGGIAGATLLIRNRFRRGQTMAYAPYLVMGAWFVLYDVANLLHSYLELL
ncbi:MAG: A24 family peptidase [Caldilineaceae bacterium]